ncbi:unnamed protein product [Ilex paraguariensis]|uniref:tRNA-splicing endonuclease subunit Sen54 N-terminal domain-containing protein n=1 Tax=Ilex paraguariensis TaxID=185542 RepID=A0ABC8R5B3_9AQUA
MEVEDWASSSGGSSDLEVYLQDTNDEEHCYATGDIPKLQFRKDISKARWNNELTMAEVVELKGRLWTTTGMVRRSKIYCSIEETLYLAEIGALHLLDDADDTPLPLKNIYKMVADGNNGCCWESFEVYRHLKSLGYIVGRHGVPWTIKSVKNQSTFLEGTPEIKGIIEEECEDERSISEYFGSLVVSEVRPIFVVYPPNNKFRKSSPGNPSFLLCLMSGHPPSKSVIEELERRWDGIPIRFCHVEHGRVSFFSFNRVELPVLP